MSDEEGLLRAWREDNDSVAKRAYADWLEEQGRGREAGILRATLDVRPVNEVKDLLGRIVTSLSGWEKGSYEMLLTLEDGGTYVFFHNQDCCEHVWVEDVIGDPGDLVGSPLLLAEESTSDSTPPGYEHEYEPESQTWTFYRFATVKGYVTVRWLGTSNGYYGEGVDFCPLEKTEKRQDGERRKSYW